MPFPATVISPGLPALSFTVVAVALGWLLFLILRRPVTSSLIASLVVCAAFVLFRKSLHGDFWYYAQDMIYEPLIRDFLRPPGESILSAAFHFGVPFAILKLFIRLSSGKS